MSVASVQSRAVLAGRLIRDMGVGWVAFRAGHEMKMRTGAMRRRAPAADWERYPLESLLARPELAEPDSYLAYRRDAPIWFLFQPADREGFGTLFQDWDQDGEGPVAAADAVLEGRLRYFSGAWQTVGFPPNWHANPFTGAECSADRHWSRFGDFEGGDIKAVWEASRFSFVFDLVRAYWRTHDERYARAFWVAVEDWRAHNPPGSGANWKCGQETSFRVMAWCFGLWGFLDAEATDAARVARLAQMVAVSGSRIEANLPYALSQRNNHSTSEAAGLWTIGILFPELHRARRWERIGRGHLERLGRELIYDDGAFSQHSTNYHRVALQTYTWCLRLADANGVPFSDELRRRVGRAALFLHAIQDETSGKAPFYGQNDGAHILPLSNCDYQDLRPAVQSAHFACTGERLYPGGPWDEELLWLAGLAGIATRLTTALQARDDFAAPDGGCYTLRSQNGFAFVRCPSYRHRPARADALHMVVWWRGRNIALDPGTYSYNAPPPWHNALSGTAAHNTVTVDGLDQMERAGRFLWLRRLSARVLHLAHSPGGKLAYWEGLHDGYQRLPSPVTHRRGILRLGDDRWLVVDRLEGTASHKLSLHWLLADLPHSFDADTKLLHLQTPAGEYWIQTGSIGGDVALSLVRADAQSTRGWTSPTYGRKLPALSLTATTSAGSGTFWSVLGPPADVVFLNDRIQIGWNGETCAVDLAAAGSGSLIECARMTGAATDVLRIPA